MVFSPWSVLVVTAYVFACLLTPSEQQVRARIGNNFTEIIQAVKNLPLVFTRSEWSSILPNSITLLGTNLTLTSQNITEKKKSFVGTKVYIRSPISTAGSTSLIQATIVTGGGDYSIQVKVENELVAGKILYFMVPAKDIFYREEITDTKIYVNFTYTTSSSRIYVSYLRTSLSWQVQYQLNVNSDRANLSVFANVRNDAPSTLSIYQAELSNSSFYLGSYSYGQTTLEDLAYTIDKPFVIDGQTSYIVLSSRPKVKVERYNTIIKSFYEGSTSGFAQHLYYLTPDQDIAPGSCVIRESDRVIGQIDLPYIAANQTYELRHELNPDVSFAENITSINNRNSVVTRAYENSLDYTGINEYNFTTETPTTTATSDYPYHDIVYQVRLQLKNRRAYPVQVQYTQQFYYYNYRNITLDQSTRNACVISIYLLKCNFTLQARAQRMYSYRVTSSYYYK